jgi:nitrous oxidase accessory protein
MQALRWAQSQFPGLHPGGVVDSAPLMKPPDVPAARATERTNADASATEARR